MKKLSADSKGLGSTGEMDRETGMQLAEKYDGKRPKSLDYFLETIGVSEKDFIDIVKANQISDWGFNEEEITVGEELPDMQDWDILG